MLKAFHTCARSQSYDTRNPFMLSRTALNDGVSRGIPQLPESEVGGSATGGAPHSDFGAESGVWG